MSTSRDRFDWRGFLSILAAIAIPVAFQNLLSTTASMVDTFMLASLGNETVAAVGLCAQFSSLMFSGYWGFVGGGMLFMSQYWGARDDKGVSRAYGLTLSFMMLVGLSFGLVSIIAPNAVMRLYTNKEELWNLGASYLRIVGFSFPLQIVVMAVSSLLRSTERVRIPLAASIVGLATNLVVNYTLIYGRFGFPCLGIRGAAIGTLISNIVNVAMLFIMGGIVRHPHLFRFRDHFRWTGGFIREYLIKCFPIICNELLIGVGNMVINVVLGRQATSVIAALAVFRTFEGFVISFFAGFTNAASILVGKEVGAGHHELAFARAKRLIFLVPTVVLTACCIFLCFHSPFLHAMKLENEAFLAGRAMLFSFTIVATIRMTNWIHNDTFRSAGDAAFGTILEITFMYALVLPCICIAGLLLHAPFLIVFLAAYVDEPVRLLINLRHMFSGKWLKPVTEEGLATIEAFRKNHGIAAR